MRYAELGLLVAVLLAWIAAGLDFAMRCWWLGGNSLL